MIARGLNEDLNDGYLGEKIPDLTYRSFSLSSRSPSGAIFLVNNQEIIENLEDKNIVDFVNYKDLVLDYNSGSFFKKTFVNGFCYKSQNEYEFLGNSCLENTFDFFDIREKPNLQNSFSFIEPRLAPLDIENFNIYFNSSSLELVLDWSHSYDYLNNYVVYEIYLFNENLNKYEFYQTTTNNFLNKRIYEVGRTYKFLIKAIDLESLSSNYLEK